MIIGIGCDHGGFELKNEIITYLNKNNIETKNFGTFSTDAVDYPDYGTLVSNAVLKKSVDFGIVICGTGIGISITCNRIKGIRCALCSDTFSAKATREHNDANVLALGGRVLGVGLALEIVKTFLETSFSNEERHLNRIKKIEL